MVAVLLVPVVLGAAALGVEVGHWFAILERVQRAADAAALAAAPLWLTDRASAQVAARDAARRNGFGAGGDTVVEVVSGDAAGRVRVTITTLSSDVLGAALGFAHHQLTRSAEASYAQPVAMGSSCNVMGNEPDPASGDGTDRADGSGSVLSSLCPAGRRPHLWVNLAGPDTSKEFGDRYASRWCRPGNSGCQGTSNTDFASPGAATGGGEGVEGQPWYAFRVSVRRPVAGISIQVFDPAQVDVGDQCQRLPRRSLSDPSWPGPARANRYVTDAASRYEFGNPTTVPASGGNFCTGDTVFASPGTPASGSPVPMTTSFAVHSPTASGEIWRAPVIPTCVRQFAGWSLSSANLVAKLTSPLARDRPLQRVFRQWVTLCTITAPEVGDYFIQVRSTVTPGTATQSRMSDARPDRDATGSGQNRFALRVDTPGSEDAIMVSAIERLSVFTNVSSGSASFLLARVPSTSAGSTLRIDLFDIGDAFAPVRLRLVRPPDARGSWPATCWALGVARGSPSSPQPLDDCTLGGVSSASGFDGVTQRIDVEIPTDYACDDGDPSHCWFRVAIDYGVDARDTTTWSASIEGDPVRLVE